MRLRHILSRLSVTALSSMTLVAACGDDDMPRGDEDAGASGGRAGSGGRTASGGAASGGTDGTASGGAAPTSGGAPGSGGKSDPGTGGTGDDGGPPDGSAPAAGDTYVITSTNRLLYVERETGAVASALPITGLAAADSALVGADFRPSDGALYALASSGKLYTIAVASGVATLKSTLSTALEGTRFGVDWNPVANRLRVVSDTGQSLRIDADTGVATTDGRLNPGTPAVSAAAYTNAFTAACRTRLYVIDAAAKTLFLQDPPNEGVLTSIGTLGANVDAGDASGFEIETAADGANAAFAVFTQGTTTRIYDVNLATGAATSPRELALEPGEQVRAVSAPPPATAPAQAAGELHGVSESNKLVSFNRAAPGKLCTAFAISGLLADENVLGIDVRPADGALYALGSSGRLYTVNPATGAATPKSTLTADAADATDAFAALAGTAFGVGFNPVPDRLRVVSNEGQNLRINVDTGATTTDAAVTPGTAVIGELAYTNAFAGAKSTTLYAVDSAADALVRIGGDPATGAACPGDAGNPNCGAVTSIGALTGAGGDVTAVGGFDIDGRSGVAGNAVVALTIGAATTSTLFNVDLETGAVTAPGATIGGSEKLRGLTFAANPAVTLHGLTTGGRLVSFEPGTPGTLTSDLAITGLQANETLLGIDVRPADGKLYALGSANRLYAVNTTTGAASSVAVLAAASGDTSAPFSIFAGVSYDADFNPAADLLRLVNDSGDNLRIVPSARTIAGTPQAAGAVFTDVSLNPVTPIVAAAYTRSYAGATATTLFGLDVTSDRLVRQGGPGGVPTPNEGLVTAIGPLGIDATGPAGFDIAGARDGLAVAALVPSGATLSALYVVNLTTGAVTSYNTANTAANAIGTSATGPVRSLAIELK